VVVLGPFQLEYWHVGVLAVLFVFFLWFMWGFLVPVRGTWERVDSEVKAGVKERITFVQFGPFVKGRRMMKGGFQEYSGLLRGRSIAMSRRDHGHEMIVGQGFPDGVASAIDGTITATMWLTLSADGKVLHGTFTPQRIEFTHQPPKITSRRFQDASFRRYKLVSRTLIDSELAERDSKAKAKGKGRQVRRTV
jgi:hypothetical protein